MKKLRIIHYVIRLMRNSVSEYNDLIVGVFFFSIAMQYFSMIQPLFLFWENVVKISSIVHSINIKHFYSS